MLSRLEKLTGPSCIRVHHKHHGVCHLAPRSDRNPRICSRARKVEVEVGGAIGDVQGECVVGGIGLEGKIEDAHGIQVRRCSDKGD
jgi:hypothetical protein